MALTKELSVEIVKRISKFIKEGNPQWSVAKGVGYSWSAMSKIQCKYKRNVVVKKGKQTRGRQKTAKGQDRKLKAIYVENRKYATKQMKNE